MKFDTICFLIRTPLTKRDYDRFGVEILKNRGFKVLFFDLTHLLNPNYLVEYQPPDPLDYVNTIDFRIRKDFVDFIKNNKKIFVVDLMRGSSDTLFIYRAFKKFNIRYASFTANSLPEPPVLTSRYDYTSKKILTEKLAKYTKKIVKMKNVKDVLRRARTFYINKKSSITYSLPHSISRLQPPKFIIVDGYKYIRNLPKPGKKTEIVWAHTLDYDLYLLNKVRQVTDDDYCVFLDEYTPYDPDNFIIAPSPTTGKVKPKDYYEGLNRFFDWFEERYKMPVIIAAHPRAHYDKKNNCFKGRRVERGKTADFISKAKCVLAQRSTAINFAVIYRKPIIFLTSNQIEKTIYGPLISNFASQFNKRPINVDQAAEYNLENDDFKIDEDSYSKYFSNYIKVPGTPEKPFWDIVADHILSLS